MPDRPIAVHLAHEPGVRGTIPLAAVMGLGEHPACEPGGWFDKLRSYATANLRQTSLADADVVVHAHDANSPSARAVAQAAKSAGKPCLFFSWTDDLTPADHGHGTVYRASIRATQRTPRGRGAPAFVEDLQQVVGDRYRVRPWQEKPSVGFMGYTGNVLIRSAIRLKGDVEKAAGLSLRHACCARLRRTPGIEPRLVERTKFLGAAASTTHAQRRAERVEFIDNLLDADYALCLRGKGNYSFRFYEVLALGRVPLFVDSACVLPFEEEIDWRNVMAWADEREVPSLGERFKSFHRSVTPERFEQMQRDVRKLWEDYLAPDAFFRRVLEREAFGVVS